MSRIISTSLAGVVPARRSASEWRVLMELYATSAETRQQFCVRHGVALSTFDRWGQRLRQDARTRAAARSSVPAATSALFVLLADLW